MLCELLQIKSGLTAIIGGGGKSTLLYSLAQECASQSATASNIAQKETTNEASEAAHLSSEHATQNHVIVATSTKMLVPDWCPVLIDPSVEEVRSALSEQQIICVGSIHEPSGKLDAPTLSFEQLTDIADYVIVEADGAKMLPIKAHASHEPVIPACANQTISVVGIDCIGEEIAAICHRPELFAQIAEAKVTDTITPSMVAKVLITENLHQRVLINKVESEQNWLDAKEVASQLNCPVIAGSLREGVFQCLS